MAGIVNLVGSDTIVINNHVIVDIPDADIGVLTFPNEVWAAKKGKNGNTIFAYNVEGELVDFVLRVLRGSDDDKFLNSLQVADRQNPALSLLVAGSLTQQEGDGNGNATNINYALLAGKISKGIEGKTNVSGDTEQAVATYHFKFAEVQRQIV